MPEEALDNFHLPIANSEIHYGKDQPRFFYPSLNRDGSEPSRQKWIVTPSSTYKRTAFGADTPPHTHARMLIRAENYRNYQALVYLRRKLLPECDHVCIIGV